MSVEDLVTATYKCQSCGTQSSPEWRRGPSGHKTLCNACGLRYSRSIARQEKMVQQQQQQENDACSPLSFLDMPRFICKNSFQ
ncbi:Putative GATA zinc finger domain-containing protein 14 [Rhizopus microsporus]|nr:Putative GATA zinc finger domain-containing protein 14 [Rhizopus microsporus]